MINLQTKQDKICAEGLTVSTEAQEMRFLYCHASSHGTS